MVKLLLYQHYIIQVYDDTTFMILGGHDEENPHDRAGFS